MKLKDFRVKTAGLNAEIEIVVPGSDHSYLPASLEFANAEREGRDLFEADPHSKAKIAVLCISGE